MEAVKRSVVIKNVYECNLTILKNATHRLDQIWATSDVLLREKNNEKWGTIQVFEITQSSSCFAVSRPKVQSRKVRMIVLNLKKSRLFKIQRFCCIDLIEHFIRLN